jgi:uroporphyrinogen decarboxylase
MMNARQRFHEICDFNPAARSLKWEFGYWGETIKNWYAQGLPQKNYPKLRTEITTPASSLYVPAWTCRGDGVLPNGIAVFGGAGYWPTQGFPLDSDVRTRFGMDTSHRLVDVNLLFDPMFEIEILDDNAETLKYRDIDGGVRLFLKEEATIPTSLDWPVTGWESWNRLKEERCNLTNIAGRFPKHWPQLVEEYRTRDYPLALGGYPQGFFGTLVHLCGYENIFLWYYEHPDLIHDMMRTFTDIWLAVFEEVLAHVEVDDWQIWEDMSDKNGSMISPAFVREFMLPYMKRIADFFKARGVRHIHLDTDGDCRPLIPLFREAGVTGMWPFEQTGGVDLLAIRKQYPDLMMYGGIAKGAIAAGRGAIDAALAPLEQMLAHGGYIPHADHFVPPDVSLEDFTYYRERLNALIDHTSNGGLRI